MLSIDALEIVRYPHPALRWTSKPLKRVDDELRAVVRRMFTLMYEAQGIGLAANQVALPYQLFVLNVTGDREQADQEQVLLNPAVLNRRGVQEAEEGCLSLPDLFGQVRRAKNVEVEALDLDGRAVHVGGEDLAARALQHEIDHLAGTLFIDRMSDAGRRELQPRLDDFERHFRRQQELGLIPSDEEIRRRLLEAERLRT